MTAKLIDLADAEAAEREVALVVDTIGEFLGHEFPPRQWVMEPIIPQHGLTMCFSWRGTGKTYVSLGIAYAVAAGGKFLRWSAPVPRKTLFIDGEMTGTMMQQRLREIALGSKAEAAEDALHVLTPDRQTLGIMPNLSTREDLLKAELTARGVSEAAKAVTLAGAMAQLGEAVRQIKVDHSDHEGNVDAEAFELDDHAVINAHATLVRLLAGSAVQS
jgi:Mrp family chromosome partitioning ATPase